MDASSSVWLALRICAGCTGIPAPAEPSDVPTTLGQSFDPAASGAIHGRVVWEGDIPVAEQFLVRAIAFNPYLHKNPARYSTPHLPRVNSQNRGVADAVVFLRGIDPRRSRPWDHTRARVEFHERQLQIAQGNTRSDVGFVRRGDSIEIVNRIPSITTCVRAARRSLGCRSRSEPDARAQGDAGRDRRSSVRRRLLLAARAPIRRRASLLRAD